MDFRRTLFQNLLKIYLSPQRTCSSNIPKPIQYPGFTYYPRHENFKDPPYTPTKLFLIKRIKSMSGTTKEQKMILATLNIDGKVKLKGHISVVKNIPEINERLWKVKHLIEIKPIKWTGELPKDGDFTGTFLRETGEFIISPKLKISEQQLDATDKYLTKKEHFHGRYIEKFLSKKWLDRFSPSV